MVIDTEGLCQPSAPRSRSAKIVASIGPATWEPAILGKLVDAGIDVARFNFKHNSPVGGGAGIRLSACLASAPAAGGKRQATSLRVMCICCCCCAAAFMLAPAVVAAVEAAASMLLLDPCLQETNQRLLDMWRDVVADKARQNQVGRQGETGMHPRPSPCRNGPQQPADCMADASIVGWHLMCAPCMCGGLGCLLQAALGLEGLVAPESAMRGIMVSIRGHEIRSAMLEGGACAVQVGAPVLAAACCWLLVPLLQGSKSR